MPTGSTVNDWLNNFGSLANSYAMIKSAGQTQPTTPNYAAGATPAAAGGISLTMMVFAVVFLVVGVVVVKKVMK